MKYEYKLLNYIHDTLRNESVNVGILFYSSDAKIVRFGIRPDLGALRAIFPDFNQKYLKKYLENIRNSFEEYQVRYSTQLPLQSEVEQYSVKLLPPDASSIQWGKRGSGFDEDLEAIYEYLMTRFVCSKSTEKAGQARSDNSVWSTFRKELQQRQMLDWFKPMQLDLEGFRAEIPYAYQNGALHCLKPLSLDMTNEDMILEKVYKTKGWHDAIEESNPDKAFKFYFLVGRPSKEELLPSYENACALLRRDKHAVLITEEEAIQLPSIIQRSSSH